ncbi:major outer membrane protein [Campylobacter troglodytis]|uniref:major outer membrane protein n=1 Tax=Campylobacter troglodytis TaxID=654363 RepID=UPI00163D3950|nr:major outer membrane protein [Campylobacter troglodytis]
MKAFKLSLLAFLATSSFNPLLAKPLEEAIKNVDISGHARYRYEAISWRENSLPLEANGISSKNDHRFRAALGLKFDVSDNFKIYSQLFYHNDRNDGHSGRGAQTSRPITLRQAYLEYHLADYGYKAILGRQELKTIWTADFVGMAAKGIYNPIPELTVLGFAIDSFEGSTSNNVFSPADGDAIDFTILELGDLNQNRGTANTRLYKYNLYGGAIIGDFQGLKAELWGAYWQHAANLWALNLKYNLPLNDELSLGVKASYLANSIDSYFKNNINGANGQLLDARLFMKAYGLDATVGGITYGKKDKLSINTIEDAGSAELDFGKEIYYQKGSFITVSQGQSSYAYAMLGYTLPLDLRLGVQAIFGDTRMQNIPNEATVGAGKKMELVGEGKFKYNKNLEFLAWYSYLSTKHEEVPIKSLKHTVRFQAYYRF